jgi:hypothetical protein
MACGLYEDYFYYNIIWLSIDSTLECGLYLLLFCTCQRQVQLFEKQVFHNLDSIRR